MKQKIISRTQMNRVDFLLERIHPNEKILHIGCSDHPFTKDLLARNLLLHQRILEVAPDTIGLDIEAAPLNLLKSAMPQSKFILGDAELLDEYFPSGGLDMIIAAEVMEHLSNPGAFLKSAQKVLTPAGKILITVPNTFSIRRYFHVFRGKENNHPDHTFYFSENTIRVLAGRYGFQVGEAFYYPTPTQGSLFKKILYLFLETIPAALFGKHLLEGMVLDLRKMKAN